MRHAIGLRATNLAGVGGLFRPAARVQSLPRDLPRQFRHQPRNGGGLSPAARRRGDATGRLCGSCSTIAIPKPKTRYNTDFHGLAGMGRAMAAGTGIAGTSTARPTRRPITSYRPMPRSSLLTPDEAKHRAHGAERAGCLAGWVRWRPPPPNRTTRAPSAPDRRSRADGDDTRTLPAGTYAACRSAASGSSATTSSSAPAPARSSARRANSAGSGHFRPRRSSVSSTLS